jgi:hypothetical protein
MPTSTDSLERDTLTGRWFEVFKAGTHTDSKRIIRIWTPDELEQMVKNFIPDSFSVPVTLGHNVTCSTPAHGWVSELKIVGNSLYCRVKHLTEKFLDMFNSKQIPNRSLAIELTENGPSLVHLAFLGAVPPAIDLEPILSFSQVEKQVFHYEVFMPPDQPTENDTPLSVTEQVQEDEPTEPEMEMEVESSQPPISQQQSSTPTTEQLLAIIANLNQENKKLEIARRAVEDELIRTEISSIVKATMDAIRQTTSIPPYIEDGNGLTAFVSSLVSRKDAIKYTSADGSEKTISTVEFFSKMITSLAKSSSPVDVSYRKPSSNFSAPQKTNSSNHYEMELVEMIVSGAKNVRPS